MGGRWWDDYDDDDLEDSWERQWDGSGEWDDHQDENEFGYGVGRREPTWGMLGPGGMPLPLMWDIWSGNWPPDGGADYE